MATTKLDAAIAAAVDANSGAIGQILRELCRRSARVAELVERDMDVPELGLKNCAKALYEYAKKHQKGGCWACPVMEITPENEVVRVILDFYKIPGDWLFAEAPAQAAAEDAAAGNNVVNLLDLL